MDHLYALEPEPVVPDLPGSAVVRRTFEDVLDPAAADLYLHAITCVRSFGDFHLALSVGDAQTRLAIRLMVDPAFRWLPWNKTHVWMIQSGPGDAAPAFAEFAAILRDHAGIPRGQFHAVPDSADPAADYERDLQAALAWREKGHDRLDYALLGLEPSGEPRGWSGGPDLIEAGGLCGHARGGGVALTARMLAASRLIAVVATGEASRPGVARLASGDLGRFAAIQPIGGSMRWYLDDAACPEG